MSAFQNAEGYTSSCNFPLRPLYDFEKEKWKEYEIASLPVCPPVLTY
jgi:hypothetical protein